MADQDPPVDNETLIRFLFARPVPLEGELSDEVPEGFKDKSALVRHATALFNDFGQIAVRFDASQIDQGLWILFGYPLFFGRDDLFDGTIPVGPRVECIRAMFHPFRDYYAKAANAYAGTSFYMWWDNVLEGRFYPNAVTNSDMGDAALQTLKLILSLPSDACIHCALHGLNHLYPYPGASEAVADHLEANRHRMSAEEIAYGEECGKGYAL